MLINPDLSLAALRRSYLEQRFTPQELMYTLREQALRQASNNAWITLLSENQLRVYLDALADKDPHSLPLYGVPFAIKDNIDLAGVPTTAACPAFAYTPTESATVVQLLIAAGAIPLGKTNMDQFATGLVGTRSPYGEVTNAFNAAYISGGSSSGSAVATALGQVSFALGTDTAGSGRVPAVLNNLIGVKPSRGLLSTHGVVPACKTLDCVSIFALNCDDAATLLDIVAQFDARDVYARHNPYHNRRRYYRQSLTPFRFGVPATLEFCNDSDTQVLFEQSVAAFVALGGEPVAIDFSPFLEVAKLLYSGPWVAERKWATQSVSTDAMLPVIRDILATADQRSAVDTFAAHYRLAELKQQCDTAMATVSFMLLPTTPTIYTREQIAAQPIALNAILGTYTNFMNLLDYCATAVPVGFTTGGVPWGVTLCAPAFADFSVLSYANQLQRTLALPQGATAHSLAAPVADGTPQPPAYIDIAVCGAHLEGQPLHWQLRERGGVLKARTTTSSHYRLFALPDGKRPALVRDNTATQAIAVEVWTLPAATAGSFIAGIPAPLGVGKLELADGSWVSGFICDHYGLDGATEISHHGGWLAWLHTSREG